MRKIENRLLTAFKERRNYKEDNCQVVAYNDIAELYLHGHLIAREFMGKLTIDTCGWNTKTTRSRLNMFSGVNVRVINGNLYLNNEPWDGKAKELKKDLFHTITLDRYFHGMITEDDIRDSLMDLYGIRR